MEDPEGTIADLREALEGNSNRSNKEEEEELEEEEQQSDGRGSPKNAGG